MSNVSFRRDSSQIEGQHSGTFSLRTANAGQLARLLSENKLEPAHQLLLREGMNDWSFGDMGIFELNNFFNGNLLAASTMFALQELGLVEKFNLPRDKLSLFLQAVQASYLPSEEVTYHNAIHATEVVQSCYWLLKKGE